MSVQAIILAFSLTLMAGLATGVGGLLVFFTKRLSPKFLAGSLGLSAGVMIYISFVEIFPKSLESLAEVYGDMHGYIYATIAFFIGVGLIALIDKLVPNYENPHEPRDVAEIDCEELRSQHQDKGQRKHTPEEKQEFKRLGGFSAFAIALHNFPEGLVTFMAALYDPALGITIAVAIAIHNIPEGVAIAVPIYYATESRKKALFWSILAGLAEPVGALLGFFLLRAFLSESLFGYAFALVAGIMVYISLDELLPTAEKYGEHHVAIIGVFSGMVIMAASLILLGG